MGYVQTEERTRMEIEEFKRLLAVAFCSLNRRKDDEQDHFHGMRFSLDMEDDGDKLVCVTSGVSFLGLAIVNRLLTRGYAVRILVDNEEDIDKLRDLERAGEMRSSGGNNYVIKAITTKLNDVDSLTEAFEGCRGVFHTSAFTDPAGLSGYTKSMAELEVKASENVIEACSRTASVRSCVLTSSLLACLWRDVNAVHDLSSRVVINHESWSDESLCVQKKLWYALGKLRAEKAAWKVAKEKGLKLATICPGLITGPEFSYRNPTATIAYLKGAREMFGNGLLATVDVMKLAEAHARVFEAMNKTAFGRYICFDRIVEREDEAEKLAGEIGIPANKICENSSSCGRPPFVLSNRKLSELMTGTIRGCYYQHSTDNQGFK